MALIGFHVSHELNSPYDSLRHIQRAQTAGFQAAMCSDHFHPWTPEQGHSPYSFAWLGAAMMATDFPVGTICCPTGRYHPAVVAQAAATLATMFPDRFWLGVGTGELLNEHILGQPWRPKPERQMVLLNAVRAIRALWQGQIVTTDGPPIVDRAKLYTRPARPPLLVGAAITPETAAWVGSWADGLLTVSTDVDQLREVVSAFRAHGGRNKPMFLQSMVGYDTDEDQAWRMARERWPVAALENDAIQDTALPEEFAAATRHVSIAELKEKLRVSSDIRQHRKWIETDLGLGFDAIYVYTISGTVEGFIDAYGKYVLPEFSTLITR